LPVLSPRTPFSFPTRRSSDLAKHLNRTLKLNDLIPELQQLVSAGKLGTTAGEQLAHMTEENQRALLNVLGNEIEQTTVAQAKDRSEEHTSELQSRCDLVCRLL